MVTNYNGGIVLSDISDHFLIFSDLQPNIHQETMKSVHKRSFSNKNRNSFKQEIAKQKWENIYQYKDTQSAYSYLPVLEIIRLCLENKFPRVTVIKQYKDRLPWLTGELKKDVKTKNLLYLRYKKHPTQINSDKYKHIKNLLNKRLVSAKRKYYNDLLIENKSNMKKYWSVIKEVINNKKRTPYPSYFNCQSSQINCDTEIANKFNDFFVNIGSNLAAEIPHPTQNIAMHGNYSHSFFLEPTTYTEIELVMSRLNVSTQPILLSISKFLIEPLVYIIHLSFLEGVVPTEVKTANKIFHYINQMTPINLIIIDLFLFFL